MNNTEKYNKTFLSSLSIEEKNLESIDTTMEEINQKWQEVSTQLYEESGGDETPPPSEGENTTDVEFEEVK